MSAVCFAVEILLSAEEGGAAGAVGVDVGANN